MEVFKAQYFTPLLVQNNYSKIYLHRASEFVLTTYYSGDKLSQNNTMSEFPAVWYGDGEAISMLNEAGDYFVRFFYLGGVRVTPRDTEGFFLQNSFLSKEEIYEQNLPRKEPLESPWKKRTYSK
ncbi:hypothetical protein COM54_03415 [Bacillus toyonensis]|uniref:hypothetical protein n=1 Tax=Bacillus toyonensis TaxID=155322 RepID=UPI000BF2D4B0|nr:hypothetical protein [Bacillus toyonensis]PGE14372.1 hypothetical protein COM54_03415 [Bacillus toyonensis]